MITFYGDWVANDLSADNIWNHYLFQNINAPDAENQQFTGHPQLDSAIFKYFQSPVRLDTFVNYKAGERNVVIIGLHGGWHTNKLKFIKDWFFSDLNRLQAWNDTNCQIVLDYCEEGFTTEVFPDLWRWIENNNLVDRILFVSSSCNVSELYNEWCIINSISHNMKTVWYGFFTNWVTRDRKINQSSDLPMARWTPGTKRYMSLNRRPWQHRILLTTLLERSKIIKAGAVSMPKEFSEPEVIWKPEDFDIQHQWMLLKNRFNGRIDSLEPNFQSLYSQLPLIADTDDFGINYALNLNEEFYAKHPINVVSETLFFSAATFLSEKIWKPMLLGQIFLVIASPFYLQSLRNLGFRTFSPWINEEYDLMLDPIERSLALVKTLKGIVNLSDLEFQKLLEKCRPALEHNKQIITNPDKVNKLISIDVAESIERYWTT